MDLDFLCHFGLQHLCGERKLGDLDFAYFFLFNVCCLYGFCKVFYRAVRGILT